MWDDKKFFEDFVRESEEIKPDEYFVEKVVNLTREEQQKRIVSFRGVGKMAAAVAMIVVVISLMGVGFNRFSSSDSDNITKPNLQAAGEDESKQDKVQVGKIEDILENRVSTVKSMLESNECNVTDEHGSTISDEEREELLLKIESVKVLDKLPENADKVDSYTLEEGITIVVKIIDDKYLIIDNGK